MGASLATGGLAFFGDARKQAASADGAPAEGELSLSKAQMLFWTVLLLI